MKQKEVDVEKLYRKVFVKERLPEKIGYYLTNDGNCWCSGNEFPYPNIEWWLEEVLQSNDKMFSLEDMKEAVQRGIEIGIGNYVPEYRDEEGDLRNTNPKITEDVKEYIQSLTKEQETKK